MAEPLDEQYLIWLYSQVASVRQRNNHRTYWTLFGQLYRKQFVWFVPNDDNRVEDGRELRYEFFQFERIDADEEWAALGCSFLELLIGLSRRLAFEGGGRARDWFWHLLKNLDLDYLNDATYYAPQEVDGILDRVIYRTYDHDGSGGLFPLQAAQEDQRKVELWYQLSAYILERL